MPMLASAIEPAYFLIPVRDCWQCLTVVQRISYKRNIGTMMGEMMFQFIENRSYWERETFRPFKSYL